MKDKQEKAKIVLSFPCGDFVHTNFMRDYMSMLMYSQRKLNAQLMTLAQTSSSCMIGRNIIAAQAVGMDADFVMFLDTDMGFPENTLEKLLSNRKPFVCCDASRRAHPFNSVCKGLDGKPIDYTRRVQPLLEIQDGSCAVALVSVELLKKMKAPWFLFDYEREKQTLITEDYFFTRRIREVGEKVYCDTELSRKIAHFGIAPYMLPEETEESLIKVAAGLEDHERKVAEKQIGGKI